MKDFRTLKFIHASISAPTSSLLFRICFVGILTAMVAAVDFVTGNEVRIAPFYFIPISLAAIWLGQGAAYFISAVCGILWALSNYHAGLRYSSNFVWIWNAFIEAAALALVAFLVAQLRIAQLREVDMARVDRLTGLANARGFHEQAAKLVALCHREEAPLAAAFVDLDNFKLINDSFGHKTGDEVIRDAAKVMKANLRESDIPARLGGDEFIILLPDTTVQGANELLERIRCAIEFRMLSMGYAVTASIGGIAYRKAADSLDKVIGNADRVMYMVKKAGKNRVLVEAAKDKE